MEPVTVGGLSIGTGRPKMIVPLMGQDTDALLREAEAVRHSAAQLAEWRLDWFDAVFDPDALLEAAAALRAALGELPLLATFRTEEEGGNRPISPADYARLIRTLAESGLVELIDIQLFTGDDFVRSAVDLCHANGVKVVLSNHDFNGTPPRSELIARLRRMEALGADLSKLAVMPRTPEDVLTLLSVTREVSSSAARPVVTMSMGKLGTVSRLAGELVGSALTFGSAGTVSAPGQVSVDALSRTLSLLSLED